MYRVVLAVLLALPAPALAGGLIDRFGAPAWEVGGKQPGGIFGYAATSAGDVDGDGYNDVIVGAELEDSTFTDEGVVYLFRGSANGTSLTPSWVYRGRQLMAYAGQAVASAGDVNRDGYADVLVAVPGWDTGTNTNAGKVVVFHGGPSGLSTTPDYEIFSPSPSDNQQFGLSVAPAGDVNGDGYADVVVGTRLLSGNNVTGSAYIFEGGVAGLFPTPSTTVFGWPVGNSFMGSSVSGAGDINADGFADVILGSPGESRLFDHGGAAYVLLGKPSGPAELDTVLAATAGDQSVGQSVSVAGDVNGDGYSDVIIGVPGFNTSVGKARIGYGGPLGITTVTDLPNPEALANEFTGFIVATLGDLNGDGFADVGVVSRYTSGTSRGRISVYLGSRSGPQYFGEILTHGSDGFFGNCLGTTGDTDGDGFSEILVGTEDVSVLPGQHEGVAYQFKLPRTGLRLATGGWPRLGPQAGTGFGTAVAGISRFDNNDLGKVAIGDPQFSGSGKVYVHEGDFLTGVNFFEGSTYPATGTFQSFGARIVDAGDTDGDHFSDFASSKTTINATPKNQVGSVVLHKGASSNPPAPVTIVTGVNDFDRVGSALAGRGDVNGDGYHDLVIGAREWDDPGKADCGKVWVYFGGASGLLGSPPWSLAGGVAGQGFGAGVALTDLDGDGYSDVIVGSSSPVFAATTPGRVEVFYGSATGLLTNPGLVYVSPVPDVSYGLTVAAIGDVTDDGIADLAVGAPREANHGVVRIYQGSLARSQSQAPKVEIEGTQANARLGEAIAGGGDVDGDGIGDLAIGEPGWDGGLTDEGRFALYYGGNGFPDVAHPVYIESDVTGAALGASIAPFRDLNLDGFADVVVGAPGAAGRVYPYMGGATFGMRLEIQPVDYGVGGSPRALHPARSHDPDQVASYFFYNTAAQGRSKIGFEIEIKPSSQAFDGVPTNLTGPTAFDSGPPGPTMFAFPTSFLSPELPGRTLKIRGRWVTPNPLFPRTRWVTPEAHASGDHDVWLTGTSVGVPASGTDALRIQAIAPNPSFGARPSLVSFAVPRPGAVSLDVYDLRGALVRRLLHESRPAGPGSIAWDGKDDDGQTAAAGVYMVILRAADAVQRAKLVRLP